MDNIKDLDTVISCRRVCWKVRGNDPNMLSSVSRSTLLNLEDEVLPSIPFPVTIVTPNASLVMAVSILPSITGLRTLGTTICSRCFNHFHDAILNSSGYKRHNIAYERGDRNVKEMN